MFLSLFVLCMYVCCRICNKEDDDMYCRPSLSCIFGCTMVIDQYLILVVASSSFILIFLLKIVSLGFQFVAILCFAEACLVGSDDNMTSV